MGNVDEEVVLTCRERLSRKRCRAWSRSPDRHHPEVGRPRIETPRWPLEASLCFPHPHQLTVRLISTYPAQSSHESEPTPTSGEHPQTTRRPRVRAITLQRPGRPAVSRDRVEVVRGKSELVVLPGWECTRLSARSGRNRWRGWGRSWRAGTASCRVGRAEPTGP